MRRAHLAGAGSQNRPLTTRGRSKWKRMAPSLARTGESTTNTDGVRPCCYYAIQRKTGRRRGQQAVVGGDGELAAQKREETKQVKSQQAQGRTRRDRAGQSGKDWMGPRKGKVCACRVGEGTGWTGMNMLVFLCWGVDLPVLETECVCTYRYVPTTVLSMAVGGVRCAWCPCGWVG